MKLQTPRANAGAIANLRVEEFDISIFLLALQIVRPIYHRLGGSDKVAKGPEMIAELKAVMKSSFSKERGGKAKPRSGRS